jgi:hypothetical protein
MSEAMSAHSGGYHGEVLGANLAGYNTRAWRLR